MIKLDIGCGGLGTKFPDFVGIDTYPAPAVPRQPDAEYLQLNFVYAASLFWDNETIDEIICLHVIEHLSRAEGLILLNRIWQLLKPGASAYVSCPNTALFAAYYIMATQGTIEERRQAREFWLSTYPKNGKEMWPGSTALDRFFYSMHDSNQGGHVTPYDYETLVRAANEAGIPAQCIKPLPKKHEYEPKRWETGIIITK